MTYGAWQRSYSEAVTVEDVIVIAPSAPGIDVELELRGSADPTFASSATAWSGTFAAASRYLRVRVGPTDAYRYWRLVPTGSGDSLPLASFTVSLLRTLDVRATLETGAAGVYLEAGGVVGGGGSSATALDDLSDVTITTPTEGDTLRYVSGVWVNDGTAPAEPIATAHVADATDAHDASAVSILDAGSHFTSTDVEGALQELGAGGGGGGGTVTVLKASRGSDVTINPTPTSTTSIAGLSVTVPASGTARTVLVTVFLKANPTNFRPAVMLDGSSLFEGNHLPADSDPISTQIIASYPLAIPGDSATHVVAAGLSAQASTGSSTVKTGSYLVVLDGLA